MKTKTIFKYLLFLCCIWPIFGWLHRCPLPEDLPERCQCQKENGNVAVRCRGFSDTNQLSEALATFQNYVLDALVLSDSGVFHMVPGLFKRMHVHRLTFRNVSFDIFPLLSSLSGSERILEELTFDDCTVAKWIWSGGTQFGFLRHLTFKNTALPQTLESHYFQKFPNKIEKLTVRNCRIEQLESDALKRFASLKELKIEDNLLPNITRDSLAPSLQRLSHLSLRGNPLRDLPDDMFSNMPRLETLLLGETRLKALRRETFEPVWEQLERVFFNNVVLRCDCGSAWLIEVDESKMPAPPDCDKSHKSIRDMRHKDLCPTETDFRKFFVH